MQKKPTKQDVAPVDLETCERRLVWANQRRVEPEYLSTKLYASSIMVGWLLREGECRIIEPGEQTIVKDGHWVFPKQANGIQCFTEGTKLLSVRFVFRNRQGSELFARNRHLVFPAEKRPELSTRAEQLVQAVTPWASRKTFMIGRDSLPLTANLEIEAAFTSWLAAYTRTMLDEGLAFSHQQVEDSRVRQALSLIQNHPPHLPFRVSELAANCGLGVNQLGALVRRATGRSPLAHYEHLREERARHLLGDTDHTVKEIAWDLGFSSLPHFSNWFRRRTGFSPRTYRHTGM